MRRGNLVIILSINNICLPCKAYKPHGISNKNNKYHVYSMKWSIYKMILAKYVVHLTRQTFFIRLEKVQASLLQFMIRSYLCVAPFLALYNAWLENLLFSSPKEVYLVLRPINFAWLWHGSTCCTKYHIYSNWGARCQDQILKGRALFKKIKEPINYCYCTYRGLDNDPTSPEH